MFSPEVQSQIQFWLSVAIIPLATFLYRTLKAHTDVSIKALSEALAQYDQKHSERLENTSSRQTHDMNGLGQRVSSLEQTVTELRVTLAKDYVTHADVKEVLTRFHVLAEKQERMIQTQSETQISFLKEFQNCKGIHNGNNAR